MVVYVGVNLELPRAEAVHIMMQRTGGKGSRRSTRA
jgi:hypothetical protein